MFESPLHTIRAAYDALHRKDPFSVAALFTRDAVLYQTDVLPWGGRYHGVEGALRFFASLGRHLDARVAISQVIPAVDTVVIVGRMRGIARRTGRYFDVACNHVWTFDEGRVSGFESYVDTDAMLEALGEGLRRIA